MRLSYTALETYQTCPLKFKFKEIDKIKTPQTKEAFFGSLIHEILKILHEPNQITIPSQEDILRLFSQKWQPEIFSSPEEEAIAFSQGIKILKDYYAKNFPARFNIVNLEARFEAPILDGDELHIITGVIDRIDRLEDGIFEVIDYKTGKKMPSQKSVDQNLQLSVYYLGIVNRWPSIIEQKKPIKLSLYYLQHGEKLSTIKTLKDLAETKEKILGIIDQIKNSISQQNFPPQQNPLCDWCQFQPWCPLFKHKFKKPMPTDTDIKAAIDEILELKSKSDEINKRMSELKNLINLYYDEQGIERVFSENGYITRSSKKIFVYDAEALKDILEPIGKWKEVLIVDTAKLKNVIASLPLEIRRKIEKIKRVDKEIKTIMITKNKTITPPADERPI